MIIAISAPAYKSGKSEVCKFIQKHSKFHFEVEKFAEPLKIFVASLIGCSREDLEDQTFKESYLGPEWDYYEDGVKKRMTVRELMIRVGNGSREFVHPAIWVNKKRSLYKPLPPLLYCEDAFTGSGVYRHLKCCFCSNPFFGWKRQPYCKECAIKQNSEDRYPNWIIDDHRYVETEGEFIEEHDGVTIRVIRPGVPLIDSPSERSLDNYKFTYTVINDGTLEELEEKIIVILQELGIAK